ncbi:MAG: 16S rRNA (uracil(1498)-N(3))-methyltransferase [Planctomycetaceae bacterium]|nr:16S rRNA (uracil(1498)-N(3))-methyltransferase [Planctomycetaceae bacterium]
MSRRFFSDVPIQSDQVTLDGSEAHHLVHVMRAKAGDELILFDGSGWEFRARVLTTSRKAVTLEVLSEHARDLELPIDLELVVALPRGDRSDWLVQKLVELGVSSLLPWKTSRSVAEPNAKSLARLRRQVIEASKQCGRNRLMQIQDPCRMTDQLDLDPQALHLIAHPASGTDAETTTFASLEDGFENYQKLVIGVGPEGGFSDDELKAAMDAGWKCIDLGDRILRTETAAIAIAAWCMFKITSVER